MKLKKEKASHARAATPRIHDENQILFRSFRTCRWFKLQGFLILKSSERHYHVVFNRSVLWSENGRLFYDEGWRLSFIARAILGEEGFDTKIVNLKEEKIKDISEYDLIIVGSGMGNCRWASEAEDFLKNFRKELEGKKLGLFASTMITFFEREGKTDDVAKTRKIALEDKVAKYSLKPIALGFFGGSYRL